MEQRPRPLKRAKNRRVSPREAIAARLSFALQFRRSLLKREETTMAIDFEIPPDAKAIRERVRKWVHEECRPAEKKLLDGGDYKTILGELRGKARKQGLWCPFI